MSAVLAHAGHWAIDLLYVVPLLVAVVILTRQTLRDRRRAALEEAEGSGADGTEPSASRTPSSGP